VVNMGLPGANGGNDSRLRLHGCIRGTTQPIYEAGCYTCITSLPYFMWNNQWQTF